MQMIILERKIRLEGQSWINAWRQKFRVEEEGREENPLGFILCAHCPSVAML